MTFSEQQGDLFDSNIWKNMPCAIVLARILPLVRELQRRLHKWELKSSFAVSIKGTGQAGVTAF